jgi:hypothetical protein
VCVLVLRSLTGPAFPFIPLILSRWGHARMHALLMNVLARMYLVKAVGRHGAGKLLRSGVGGVQVEGESRPVMRTAYTVFREGTDPSAILSSVGPRPSAPDLFYALLVMPLPDIERRRMA